MLTLRKSEDRGTTRIHWLDSRHSFSFGQYYDPKHMGHGPLRVINEDRVIPGGGFPTHPHRNMEILTYVLSGELVHEDSMGYRGKILPGEIQLISAGKGITHSEFNGAEDQDLHLLQIWILPDRAQTEPSYQQKSLDEEQLRDNFALVLSPDKLNGSLEIKQSAQVYIGRFRQGSQKIQKLNPDRRHWLQVTRGKLSANGTPLQSGDGLGIEEEDSMSLIFEEDSELIFFDLP